jgi:16S rRNA (adenine1518-N6/adenine1519-N6)-dimethyltransferase
VTGRSTRARWGQNFLVDRNICEQIVSWAHVDDTDVVEIGPGKGALTELLAERARRLTLVEIDPRLAAHWRERFADDGRVTVYHADALDVDLAELMPGPTRVVSNLPYETGIAIVRRLLSEPWRVSAAVVMLQKEVCGRLLAGPGGKAYGILAIHTQLVADVEAGRIVRATCFRPQPKVSSQLVRIVPLPAPRFEVGSMRVFEQLVAAAFTQRRKMVRNSLGKWIDERLGQGRGGELLDAVGVHPERRPETVDLETFANLSARLHAELEGHA